MTTAPVLTSRALGIDAITPVPQLLAFLPWLLAPALLAAVLGALARRPVLIALGLALAAVTAWFLRPYGDLAAPTGPVLAKLRVLTSNVEFGGATTALLDAVRREKPDLLFVQECNQVCSDALARELPPASYPYREVVEASGAEGSAILSTHPLKPAPGLPSTLAMPGAVAVVNGRAVRLRLAHPLPPVPGLVDRWKHELGTIERYVAEGGGPTLVAGDFNASQDHAAFRRVLDAGNGLRDAAALAGASRTPTWPAKTAKTAVALGAQIDHVLVSKEFGTRSARFVDLPGTDHRALLVELELHGG
ncbi:endonuclease/exonuclease/phosphatase family protein [Streptomyces sp. NBC_00237]|uniref:endonuclease/exonuclease/phosphatase family protein n=1 Tax=Streptomyces sp. NBC_00237 TaxID=2975687 RepID=UPI0022583464|nr:endonuclease/exonuclease/phosphatase family protein [Streptomyces sp. NBC_00237]MCX5200180.1 endonuclease/exonuclease/phosphatase family protein [Streptomyces sp. NBC_00237]